MLLALGAALLLGSPATGAPPAMPSAIASYYRDHNFVNAFSSPAERRVLAKTATPPADRRLAQVARALARLAERTEEVDPGIVLQDGPFGGRRRHESEFAADVVRIHSWHVDKAKAEAWVEVEGLILEDRVTGLLIAHYDRLTHRGTSMPAVDALLPFARLLPLRTLAMHHWQRIDGEWRRAPAVLILTR